MHYIIYKTINLINGKFYVGKHQTNDLNDGYIGSGKLLKRAIKKYGKENFITEILIECSSEVHMNLAEKIFVVVDSEVSYNLCPGGKGGFGFINNSGLNIYPNHTTTSAKNFIKCQARQKELWSSLEYRREVGVKISKALKGRNGHFKGKKHTLETLEKMRASCKYNQVGNKNSQFGTCWITNGKINKKIKKEDVDLWIEQGYYKGRIMGL